MQAKMSASTTQPFAHVRMHRKFDGQDVHLQEVIMAALRGDVKATPPHAPAHALVLERIKYAGGMSTDATQPPLPRDGWADTLSCHQVDAYKHKLVYQQIISPQSIHSLCQWLLETLPAWR